MSMKNTNDTIGNRTRDLPACSAVPQPTSPRAEVCSYAVFEESFGSFEFSCPDFDKGDTGDILDTQVFCVNLRIINPPPPGRNETKQFFSYFSSSFPSARQTNDLSFPDCQSRHLSRGLTELLLL
jgi:hypothetical protein